MYDYLVKVEPSQRALAQLNATATFTGRRRGQGGERSKLDIIEIVPGSPDSNSTLKLNVCASWGWSEIQEYVKERNLTVSPLLSEGYKSVGDWHSTVPVAEGEDERSGRWKGLQKTEWYVVLTIVINCIGIKFCLFFLFHSGLHKDYFTMRQNYLNAQKTNISDISLS